MSLYRITLRLFTLNNFKELQTLNQLLDVFEEYQQFYPHMWAKDDRAKSKCRYNRQDLTEMVMSCWDMETPMLYGSKTAPYEAFFSFEANQQNPSWRWLNGVYWYLDIPKNFQVVEPIVEQVFEFAHQLANSTQPEYGQLNLIFDHPQIDGLYAPGIKRDEFQKNGIPSLAIRTWMGNHLSAQIGLERLQSCGAIIQKLNHSILELDLVEKPWLADFDALIQAKKAIMANLEPSGVFGDYSNYPLPLYSPAPNWIPIHLEI
jgi:hypothetical protein